MTIPGKALILSQLSSHEIDTKENNPMLLSLFAQQSLRLVKDLSGKAGPHVYTVDPEKDCKRVVEIARCQRIGRMLIDMGNFALNESLGKKIPKGARGHFKAQPYESFAAAVSRAAASGAMAGRQLTSTERVMGLSPAMHTRPWCSARGSASHRDIMWGVLRIADAEDAITEAITIVRRSLRGDCGDIAIIGACTAARHRSVSWTTILGIIFEHYGVPYVLIHQGIGGCYFLSCGG